MKKRNLSSALVEAPEEIHEFRVVCPRCGHEWKPNPNRWTTLPFVHWKRRLARIIYCPNCGLRAHLYKEDVEKYKEWYYGENQEKHKIRPLVD